MDMILNHLLPVLRNLKDGQIDGPVLVHVVTEKGKGHPFAGPSLKNIMRCRNLMWSRASSQNHLPIARPIHLSLPTPCKLRGTAG